MRGPDLLAWLASLAPPQRDGAVEQHLGIAEDVPASPPGEHLIGYHASGVASIVRMLIEVPVSSDDVVVDLGSGMGKVVLLASLLTGAAARGIELQPALVGRAREAATRLGIAGVSFTEGDVREAYIDDGTVFFLYAPFTGPVLAQVMARLRAVALLRPIVVCALGLDVERAAPWLVRRPLDSFWLAIYDNVHPDAAAPTARRERTPPRLGPDAVAVAAECLRD
jgi:hypothetical protein